MSFTMTPRSRSPVLSIRTQSEDECTLRADIEAARTQQAKFKRRSRARWSTEPTIQEESAYEEKCTGCTCGNCTSQNNTTQQKSPVSSRQTLSDSIRSITGTVRGEFANAKQFFKTKSRGHLARARTRSDSVVSECSVVSRQEDRLEAGLFTPIRPTYAVELSSDPLYQLEDNQRSTRPSDEISRPISPMYDCDRRLEIDTAPSDDRALDAEKLFLKSYSCDGCEQRLEGGDFYDFCPHCETKDRVVCYTCAQRGGCSRHRPDQLTVDLLSARGSPAPPYTHQILDLAGATKDRRLLDRADNMQEPYKNKPDVVQAFDTLDEPPIRSPPTGMSEPDLKSTMLEAKLEELTQQLSLMQAFMNDHKDLPAKRGKNAEAAGSLQRECHATLREQQLAVREQELMLRERETMCRDREALMIRNLQSFAIAQELVKSGHVGCQSQFDKAEALDGSDSEAETKLSDTSPYKPSRHPLSRQVSKPQAEPLLHDLAEHAKPQVGSRELDERHVRSQPAQKRKKSNSDRSTSSTSSPSPQSSRGNSRKDRPGHDRGNASENQDDSEQEGSEPPKRQKSDSVDPTLPQRIFACPYCKHNPGRYSAANLREKRYRGCSGHYLPDIPRLKQHLKRVHWRPENHCPRCYEVFDKADQLTRHHEQAIACTKRECPFPERMDKTQQSRIHVKRPKMDPEALWYNIYTILFPDSPLPDSPFAEQVETVTPPLSAAPSSANNDEVSQMMMQILSERLDKQANRAQHEWLMHAGERKFILDEVSESLGELFSRVSWTATSSPGNNQDSAPPSAVISPVDHLAVPSMLSAIDTPLKPRRVDTLEHALPTAGATHQAPILNLPSKGRFGPALQKPSQNMSSSPLQPQRTNPPIFDKIPHDPMTTNQQSYSNLPTMPIRKGTDSSVVRSLSGHDIAHSCPDTGNGHIFQFDVTAFQNFPDHIEVDEGWDEHCKSYEEGDDRHAMDEAFQMLQSNVQAHHLNPPEVPIATKPKRKSRSFVPVQLKTLAPEQPASGGSSHRLQSQKSVSSLVDSGYGSGTSLNPRIREQFPNDEDEEMGNCSPIGHLTFDEQFESAMQNATYAWQTR